MLCHTINSYISLHPSILSLLGVRAGLVQVLLLVTVVDGCSKKIVDVEEATAETSDHLQLWNEDPWQPSESR